MSDEVEVLSLASPVEKLDSLNATAQEPLVFNAVGRDPSPGESEGLMHLAECGKSHQTRFWATSCLNRAQKLKPEAVKTLAKIIRSFDFQSLNQQLNSEQQQCKEPRSLTPEEIAQRDSLEQKYSMLLCATSALGRCGPGALPYVQDLIEIYESFNSRGLPIRNAAGQAIAGLLSDPTVRIPAETVLRFLGDEVFNEGLQGLIFQKLLKDDYHQGILVAAAEAMESRGSVEAVAPSTDALNQHIEYYKALGGLQQAGPNALKLLKPLHQIRQDEV